MSPAFSCGRTGRNGRGFFRRLVLDRHRLQVALRDFDDRLFTAFLRDADDDHAGQDEGEEAQGDQDGGATVETGGLGDTERGSGEDLGRGRVVTEPGTLCRGCGLSTTR